MDNQDSTQQIISCKEAKELGLTRYFTGKPCKRGHIAQRRVSKRSCDECNTISVRERYQNNRDKILEQSKEWAKQNKERKTRSNKLYREANPEGCRKANRNWKLRNLEIVSTRERNRRSAKKQSLGSHTKQEILHILLLQKGRCAYCKSKVGRSYHVDHIIPLARGGGNGKDNLQICCPKCNLRKGAKDPIAFAQELGFLL
jgi:5-methylcytosine-specific restriction endonuclease McrA